MATEQEVRDRRAENDRLRQQIAEVKAKNEADLRAANQDVALERAEREGQALEAELASLMAVSSSAEVSAPPAPDTQFANVGPEAGVLNSSDTAPTASPSTAAAPEGTPAASTSSLSMPPKP